MLLLVCALAGRAQAHPEGFSGLRVQVRPTSIHVAMTLHTRDLSAWFPPSRYPDYVNDVCRAIESNPLDLIELRLDGKAVPCNTVRSFSPEMGMVELDVDYPLSASAKSLQIWSKCLVQLAGGHQQLLFVDDTRGAEVESLLEDTLSRDHDMGETELPAVASTQPTTTPTTTPVTVLPSSSTPPRGISFFLLGIQHIVAGYDHLLFLAALLLVCKSFREAAGVITFFTVAHSITLTLAALDIVRLPPRIVEPAIAASIVYVGLENIFGKHCLAWRAGITFAFGLVHGLGFAAALREVGLGSTSVGLAMPLLKFSVGLETGQLCIALVILKILLELQKRPAYRRRWMPAGSVVVSLIGAYWLLTRLAAG